MNKIMWVKRLTGITVNSRGGREEIYTSFQVRVMAIAEGYALVRMKGAAPFAEAYKHLYESDPLAPTPEYV